MLLCAGEKPGWFTQTSGLHSESPWLPGSPGQASGQVRRFYLEVGATEEQSSASCLCEAPWVLGRCRGETITANRGNTGKTSSGRTEGEWERSLLQTGEEGSHGKPQGNRRESE